MINTLERSNIEDIVSLTCTQEGILFHYISKPNSEKYFEQLSLRLNGDIKVALVEKAWNYVIETNEMLRTIYRWQGLDKPVQITLKNNKINVSYNDFSKENDVNKKIMVENIKSYDLKEKIDITKETLRIYLCEIKENEFEMIISNHHIIFDGWSNGIILKEFFEAYNCFNERKTPIKKVKNKFKEFIKVNSNINREIQQTYWEEYLNGLSDKVLTDSNDIKKSNEFKYTINKELTAKMNNVLKNEKITMATFLYSVWGVLQQKYNNTEDIVFGTTVSGRNAKVKGIEEMVGLFINTLPLRIKSNYFSTIREFLLYVHENLNGRKEYENTPFVDIKKYGKLKSNEELFNSIVVIENYPLGKELNKIGGDISIESFSIFDRADYNIVLSINTLFSEIELNFTYDTSLFKLEEINLMSLHFENLVNQFVNNLDLAMYKLDMLTENEKNKLICEVNDTIFDYPKNITIHELFEAQVEKMPDNIAVIFKNEVLTYRQLNDKANALGRTLRDKGAQRDTIIAIMLERSLEMIIGIMGILKSGAAYLPISPEYPEHRIKYMLEDSKSNILLTQRKFINNLEFSGEIIDVENNKYYSENTENLENVNSSKDLAYVIYTSGSTGNPKGVMIENYSVINRLNWMQRKYPLNSQDVILQKTTYTFDVSVWELFWWSLVGAQVCMLEPDMEKDPKAICDAIERNKVTTIHFVPSMLNVFMEVISDEGVINKIKTLKRVFSSGEALSVNQVGTFKHLINNRYGTELINLYGPTEATVDVTYFNTSTESYNKTIPIGRPIDNTSIYILDKYNNLKPIGVLGELCIEGDGVGRGYLNRAELTLEKFIESPFGKGKRLYKTGDLARWLPDGNIEFLGRIDYQVKVRGFRIELGEIENKLLTHNNVKQTIVIDKVDNDGVKYLCAYLVTNKKIELEELKEYLSKDLPDYMIPSYFIELEKMPLSANGKINRNLLPEPEGNILLVAEYEAPRNNIEEKLVAIWKRILSVEKIGINDNFFDLGGHSLKATTLMSKIHKELKVEIPLAEIFKTPTIKSIAEYVENSNKTKYESINTIEEKEYYQVSSAQKRIYMLQQFDINSCSYNMPGVMVVEGYLHKEKLQEVFNKIIQRHESLRTHFNTVDGEIVQIVDKKIEFLIEDIKTNSNLDLNEYGNLYNDENIIKNILIEEEVNNVIKEFVRPFDLTKASLLRVGLIKLSNKKHIVMFDMHHIISDGVSLSILTNEIAKFYEGKELENIKIQYKDYSAWQNNLLQSNGIQKQEEYWVNRFSDEIPVLNMHTDYERPIIQSFEGDNISFVLNKNTTERLNKIARDTDSTLYMVLLSSVNILLSKYSGQEDIIIGSAIAGRPHTELEKIIGMFVNTLPMRNYPEGNKIYKQFLNEVRENSLKAYENQDYQFEALVEKLNLIRDISRNPLFDVMFTMQNMEGINIEIDGLTFKDYNYKQKISKFNLTFAATEEGEQLRIDIEYCTKLFKKQTIETLKNHFIRILSEISKNPNIKLSEIDVLSSCEKHKLLYEFNDTFVDYFENKTIQQLFEAQVQKTPESIALVEEGKTLTYRELNEKSNSLARTLREKGIKNNTIVAIMVERSIDVIVGMMSIIKAGGAYVPISAEYPKERIRFMLEDSASNLILTNSKYRGLIDFDGEIICFEDKTYYLNNTNLENINTSSDLAYLMYTSGSSGTPKGVMIDHKNVLNELNWYTDLYGFSKDTKFISLNEYTFDPSVVQIFGTLISGATLYIPPKEYMLDREKFERYINENKITIVNCVPSILQQLLVDKKLETLEFVITGGESFQDAIKDQLLDLGYKVDNHYGPTETTIDASYERCEKDKKVTIGKPIANTQIYIVDKYNKLVPIGALGEICISGAGLSRGYLNREELTLEKFINNPFKSNERMYRTGDLGRWLLDGSIEFLGRIDNQVKIRGFRIELGEIENKLLKHELVEEAVVLDKEDNSGNKYLCAYIALKENNAIENETIIVSELKEYLLGNLPEYMVPLYFILLEKIPLTTNGKINRRELLGIKGNLIESEYESPRTEVEEILTEIWKEVLLSERVGINDNFFEVGGHSLKAIMLINLIKKQWKIDISIKDIFECKTIKTMAERISSLHETVYEDIKNTPVDEYYIVSAAQKRMFVINQLEGLSTTYNLPLFYVIEGNLNKEGLNKAFVNLLQRHEILRTSFHVIKGEMRQKVHEDANFEVKFSFISRDTLEIVAKEFIKPFDLEKCPLIRAEVAEFGDNQYLFMLDTHHIISDGVSAEIMMQELFALYKNKELKEPRVQYRDFSVWQNKLFESDIIKNQEEYWLNMFKGELPVLSLTTDYDRPPIQMFNGNKYGFYADKELTAKLNDFARKTETTLFMVLFSAFNVMLSKLSSQEDIIVGLPAAGRQHADVQDMLGMFVNTLALRSYPKGSKSFMELLQEIKNTSLEAMKNQDYQFDMLLDNLKLEKDLSRNPLFDVFFAFQNFTTREGNLKKLDALNDLKFNLFEVENNTSKFDFIWFTFERNNELCFEVEYNTSLFKRETIEGMGKYFLNIAKDIIETPSKKLREIEMLPKEEKDKILLDFNNTYVDFNNDFTIHGKFEKQSKKTPNNIALRFEDKVFTYKEINEKANKLARVLKRNGVEKENVVGIMMDKSPQMIISILASLKAGAAYLPIDSTYPEDRIIYMLNDSKAKVLLTKKENIKGIPFTSIINLDEKETEVVLTKPRAFIKDFDSLPIPDRSLIDVSKYKGKIGMASVTDCISIQTTRGCPYLCVFCHKVWSKNHTFRSAENIYNEIDYFYKRGVTSFAIIDDCFNLNAENGKRLFRIIIKNKLKLKIFFPNGLRGDILTPDYIDLMVLAGVVNINLSLETASPRLQKLVKKHLNLDKFKNVMDYISNQHPNVILELATMHGFPTETEEEAMTTLDFIKDIKWIHFPYIHILKIFPNTEMEALALANGVDKEAIKRSANLAYHEIPDTLPFPKSFTRRYQAEFLNDYFLSKERIKKVLPVQMKILSEDALLQKYNAYLPTEIKKISDILELAGIEDFKLPSKNLDYTEGAYTLESKKTIFDEIKKCVMPSNKQKKMLFLDLSQHFTSHSMLYNVSEQPIGQLYLLTYLKERFKGDIDGRIYKSGVDFDSYKELKDLIDEYKPDFIGIRTLSFYKEFFHETVSLIRQWGVNAPIITGGPYGTSEYNYILKDKNVDLVILGEGEYTTGELVENMLKNEFNLPHNDVLEKIKGIAYRADNSKANKNFRTVLALEDIEEIIDKESGENLNEIAYSNNLAYVMYTSGSTGKPKGVMIEHRQVNNCINWMDREIVLAEDSQVVQRTALTFDPSVWEMFWPLYKGASIKLLTTETSKDAEYLIDLMKDNKELTTMYCPASMVIGMTYLLRAKGDTKSKLRLPYLVIGAEPISSEVVKDFYSYFEGEILNTYGPTECTINNTYYYLDRNNLPAVIPIGKPIANNKIYILSKNLELLPVNVLGEMYIAGEGLARGYINNEEKTKEVFIKNPFGQGRLYKTGDIARVLPDGNIEIKGRVDSQVKVRGYRIELQEIEGALQKLNKIKECAVLVKDNKEKDKAILVCKKCGITSKYPDTNINEDGVCDVCVNITSYMNPIENYFKTPEDLDLILKANRNDQSKYDCMLLYSGGRGSAYALYQLVKKGYRVLTVTYDNGYFSKADMDRIKSITKKLSVDHIVLTHEKSKEILIESLKSAGTACKGCFYTSSALAGDYAMKNGIKVVIGATLSRGQIIENKLFKLIKQGIVETNELENEILKVQRLTYDMNEDIYNLINVDSVKDNLLYDNVKFEDFYRYFDISNVEMINYLNSIDEQWKSRKNYAIYSTNCSIKQIGDFYHIEEKGHHYYGSATSWEKRLNHINLENVKEDLKCSVSEKAFKNFANSIGYKKIKEKEIDSKYICAYIVPDGEVDILETRSELMKIIPSYMVPSQFVTLDEMPLTKEGKIDKKALPEPKGQMNVKADYVKARNDVERSIVEAWKRILSVDSVGIKDNFFELGGDSIKAIQVSASLHKYDLKMAIKDLFKFPTIEELSAYVKPLKVTASQEIVEGEVPLTPIQKSLFNENFKYKHHYNQAVMLYSKGGFDGIAVEKIFNGIIEHHDALRMLYKFDGTNIIQVNSGVKGNLVNLEEFDFTNELYVENKINEVTSKIQSSISLEHGPLVKLVLFKTSDGEHLLIVIHHLVVDGVSWRIILRDFAYAYEKEIKNEEFKFENKTTSFKEWSSKLQEYSNSRELIKELSYWSNIEKQEMSILPADYIIDENKAKRRETIEITITEAYTIKLLNEVNNAYNTKINDVLLTALGLAIQQWAGEGKILIELEGHGREEIIKDVDITNTVGWFTINYPVILNVSKDEELSYNIKRIKENLRNIPNNGIGYSILKYLTLKENLHEVNLNSKPEISFNYLGQVDNDVNTNVFKLSKISVGETISPEFNGKYTLEVSGMIVESKLKMFFNYNKNQYKKDTIVNLSNSYKNILEEIINHCTQKEDRELTPSDFGNNDLTLDEVEDIMDLFNDL